jgi:hypothetical protein
MVIIQAQHRAPSLGFIDLLFEIRRHIYTYPIPQKRRFDLKWLAEGYGFPFNFYEDFWRGKSVGSRGLNFPYLLKQISQECLNILYGENIMEDSRVTWASRLSRSSSAIEPTPYAIFDRNGTTLWHDVRKKHTRYLMIGIDFSNSLHFNTKNSPKLGSRMFEGEVGKLDQMGWALFRMLWSAFGRFNKGLAAWS